MGITIEHNKIKVLTQFTQFSLVGLSNVAISLIVYYIFIFFDTDLYLVGNTLGYIAGVINAYIWNRAWVFVETKTSKLKSFGLMTACYLFTFFIQIATLFFMVEFVGISVVFAPIINVAITTPINYILLKKLVFKA
jgi:putative flippase GtrA